MEAPEDLEDILNDSLTLLGGQSVPENEPIRYGPLNLTLAPKDGKANTLLADHLFSPALLLAERIERRLLTAGNKSVIELGAGCALPSLLLASLPDPPSLVVVTDYPDHGIMTNLRNNVKRNRDVFQSSCTVESLGYEWGTDSSALPKLNPSPDVGYDVVILSDLLHFDKSHDVLISSITSLLARSTEAVVHVAAGSYTRMEVCQNFLRQAERAGLQFEAIEEDGAWLGTREVSGMDSEQLAVRKAVCRYWIGSWANLS